MDTTQMLLETAVKKLPPEILRIIASKYRRNCELKPVLCPKARFIQLSYENDTEVCYEIDGWKYVLYKNYYPDKPLYYRISVYHSSKLMAELHTLTLTFQCDVYEKFPVRILYTVLVLYKRHTKFIIDGNSFITLFKKPAYQYLCGTQPIRCVLYEKRYSQLWKKESIKNTLCTVM